MRFKVKTRVTDKLFSRYIRERDNWTCQYCGRVYRPDNARNLGCSHYFGRARESVRFDEDNAVALCTLPCHAELGHGEKRDEYRQLMTKRLGEKGMQLLEIRAERIQKRDDKMMKLVLTQMLDEQSASKS